MGRFGKKMKGSKFNSGGSYFVPGNYIVRVDGCKHFETRTDGPAFVVECTVLQSDVPAYKKGDPVSQLMLEKHDSYGGNVSHFVSVAMGVPMEEITAMDDDKLDEMMEEIVGKDNPIGGTILGVNAFHVMTKKSGYTKPFTKCVYKKPEEMQAKLDDLKKIAAELAPAEQKHDGAAEKKAS